MWGTESQEMIPFYRKIRKKLADDNQFFKYSRYAIGEVVLVVVGILIALQINNWNEKQKANRLKNVYLERHISDVANDTANINFIVSDIDLNQNTLQN